MVFIIDYMLVHVCKVKLFLYNPHGDSKMCLINIVALSVFVHSRIILINVFVCYILI